jgi:hypothetical protein
VGELRDMLNKNVDPLKDTYPLDVLVVQEIFAVSDFRRFGS